jgi:hypothetical protein
MEEEMQTELKECGDCQAAPGEAHDEDCDHAACPDCGEQLFMHECEHWPEDADGPDRPARWHGVDPRTEVARTLDWWTTATGIDHLVEDYTRVIFAIALGQVTWDPQAQKYVIGQVNEAAINVALMLSN